MCNNNCNNCGYMEFTGDEETHTFYPECSKGNEMPTEGEISKGWSCSDFKQVEGR